MSYAAIAERYARAIFELGLEGNQLPQLSEQIQRVASVFESSEELREIMDNPVVDDERRDALLKDLGARLGLAQLTLNAVRLIAERRRLRALPEIAKAVQRLADENAGVLRATVTSAQPLSDEYYRQLIAQLENATQRKILLEKHQDPSLIAGVVTTIGDHTIDGSLRGRLGILERQLVANS